LFFSTWDMRIFIYEYACCQSADSGEISSSLRRQGWAMLQALRDDFEASGIRTTNLLHESFSAESGSANCLLLRSGEEDAAFREQVHQADYIIVIAPEFSGLLLERARWVEQENGTLLSPLPEAIQLTADKLALHDHWVQLGIPTPSTVPCKAAMPMPDSFPAVVKPRFGAGSCGIRHAENAESFLNIVSQSGIEDYGGLLFQPFVQGIPVSIAFLVGQRRTIPLPPARQYLSNDGGLRYLGGELPLPAALAQRALALGRRAIAGIPGLRGYVGVDLVLEDGKGKLGDCAIEINPRLTTSYVGLRSLAESNLAQVMFEVVEGRDASQLAWKRTTVRFSADGAIL
jgi:predicted ATP-grasp superfamily ATP-dependent carboligase